MRRHAKASTAGSTQRQAGSLGRFFRGVLATRGASLNSKGSSVPAVRRLVLPLTVFGAILALMALAIPASATKTHPFIETFGSAAQPSFTEARGLAVNQSTGDVLVMDAGASTISRFKPDGTADNFSALGTNTIDGQGAGDETPQNGLSFAGAGESQIAVDNSGTATDGDIYVTQGSPNLINIFSKAGNYLGQLTAAGLTDFSEACGVAVDPSGTVYVGDYNSGIDKFVPSANPPVNTDNTANFTTVNNPCTLAAGAGGTAGFLFAAQYSGSISKLDSSTGEVKYVVSPDSNTTLTVDPSSGHVYGASGSSIKEFDASGAGSAASVSSSSLASEAKGVAVRGSSGDVYASRSGAAKVEVFDGALTALPDVTTGAATGNSGVHATLNGTVDPDGVELTECKFEYGKFGNYEQSALCAETPATIGNGTSPVAVHADISALRPNGSPYNFRLVAKNPSATVDGSEQNFTTPDTVVTAVATALTATAATLNGTVNPDGVAMTECLFEFGKTTSYGETAPCVPSAAGIGAGTSPVAVHADLSGLDVGTVYHFRLKAANANGPILAKDEALQTLGPAIAAIWSDGVARTEATLKAGINPEGSATTYHFEWGTTTAYGNSSPEASVGSDSSNHTVSAFLGELQPSTTYHYRLIASNATGINQSRDRTLTTYALVSLDTSCANQAFRTGPAAFLPDCRAYEMVSPIDKNGGDILGIFGLSTVYRGSFEQASSSGEKITFSSPASFGDELSSLGTNQYLSSRGADGWTTHGINPPSGTKFSTEFPPAGNYYFDSPFYAFTEDLSSGWVLNGNKTPLTADAVAGFGNLYRRDNLTGGFEALTVNAPTTFSQEQWGKGLGLEFRGASADGIHQVFDAEAALTADAAAVEARQIYDFSSGELHLVSVLPDGTTSPGSNVGAPFEVGDGGSGRYVNVRGAVSEDGSRVFWSARSGSLYVRENPAQPQSAISGGGECTEAAKACTIAISSGASTFWAANPAGSEALFSEGGEENEDLYVFDVDTETPTLIASKARGVLGASENLSRVYFVSNEALAAGATAGAYNLYLDHEGAMTFVATLSSRDVGFADDPSATHRSPFRHNSRVTPDGRHIAFMSDSATLSEAVAGYVNTDAVSGEPDKEIYTYEAGGELICASCNPSGARPAGQQPLLPFPATNDHGFPAHYWAAAWIPTAEHELHFSHTLSNDGSRLFFNSFDPLLPQDSNGVQDVYEWEAKGTGSCQRVSGCISLISTGESSEESEFVDASADGRDVFVRTKESIDPRDPGLIDIYDARANGGFAPTPSPSICVGDACQSAPEAPRDPTPASAGFHGAGNPPTRKPRYSCRARSRHAGNKQSGKAKHKQAKRCKRAKRGAGR